MRELLLKTKSSNSQATGSRSSWWVEPRISNPCNCGTRTLETSDFTTHFSFATDLQNRSVYGDGIAFFPAPVGSKIPLLTKGGSTMGLSCDDLSG